ncbi:DUF3515 family protein [Ruicaihuangia caeni]|uniref:DUF3515 family protein n=1 Tax=Ruicaihuangia caeni TaxID=3042517 RepID=A0AAW6T2K9_9MICO|nr:DUF3515 family protein [Klugiella sp. YN-L-19]MDI2097664.1 DUF3515 family protein [Klugiella sp. YN-L-19]
MTALHLRSQSRMPRARAAMTPAPWRSLTRAAAAASVVAATVLLTGCAATVVMEPAADSNNPACAGVIVRLPEFAGDLEQRETNAQATAAWGDPASVFLSCGVPVPAPSEMDCVEVRGIDWLRDATEEPLTYFTTYGRDPAITVAINGATVSGRAVLEDLANSVSTVPQERSCLSRVDALNEQ